MARQNHVCPFMKKTCIGCSVYRGRHMGLWTDDAPAKRLARAPKKPLNGKGSDWVTSLDAFFKDLVRMEARTFDNK